MRPPIATEPAGGGLDLSSGWLTLLAWATLVVLLVTVGDRLPEAAYGTLGLVALYLLVTHGGEVSALVTQLLAGLARPFQPA